MCFYGYGKIFIYNGKFCRCCGNGLQDIGLRCLCKAMFHIPFSVQVLTTVSPDPGMLPFSLDQKESLSLIKILRPGSTLTSPRLVERWLV